MRRTQKESFSPKSVVESAKQNLLRVQHLAELLEEVAQKRCLVAESTEKESSVEFDSSQFL